MLLRRALLLAVPLACNPSTADSDSTTDIAVTTGESTIDEPTSAGTQAPTTAGESSTSPDASTSSSTTSPEPTTAEPTTAEPTTTPDSTTTTADTTTGAVLEELPPIDSVDGLEAWLATGAYRQWAVESGVHPSTGPHSGNVLTYVNDIAMQSFAAGDPEHPQDAATVKELYGGSFDTIIGYAVSRKTAAQSDGGATWYWYERVEATTYGGELGTTLCTGCHGGGTDYILTPYPLQ